MRSSTLGLIVFVLGIRIAGSFAARKAETPHDGEDSASPAGRISAWFELSGTPYLGGLGLMVLGGFIARRRTESPDTASPPSEGTADDAPANPQTAPTSRGRPNPTALGW